MTNEEFQKLVLDQLGNINSRMGNLENEVNVIKSEMATKQDFTRMEQTHGDKLSALFDAHEVQFDVNERICDTLNRIEGKMD